MTSIIETERLIIRELIPEDAPGIFELDSDPEVQRYLGNKPLKNITEAHDVIAMIRQQYQENGIGRWAVLEKATHTFLGWTGLKFHRMSINGQQHFYELGYRFIKKYWGMGFATESAIASVSHGFNEMKLTEIFAMTHIENLDSQHVLGKAGLHYMNDFFYLGEWNKWYKISNNNNRPE